MPAKDPRFGDPMMRAPAGYSLTQPKGKWPWEKPPRFVDPNEAVTFILDKIEESSAKNRYLKLMLAGVTIEEIVESIARGGFATGNFTPDVAELIKGPVAIYLMGLADDNEIPVRVFSTDNGAPPQDDEIDDITILEIMKKKNPKVFRDLVAKNREIEEAVTERMAMGERRQQGFLAVEESPELFEDEAPEQEEMNEE